MIISKKITTNIEERLPYLIKKLNQESDVVLAYVFGSYARRRITPLSDFDLAVLLDDNISTTMLLDKERELFSIVSKILKTDEIDLIILNSVPVELQFAVLKEGNLIFCKDDLKRIEFRESVVSNYIQTRPLRQEIYYHLQDRIKRRIVHD